MNAVCIDVLMGSLKYVWIIPNGTMNQIFCILPKLHKIRLLQNYVEEREFIYGKGREFRNGNCQREDGKYSVPYSVRDGVHRENILIRCQKRETGIKSKFIRRL